jgi:hypothetical protein
MHRSARQASLHYGLALELLKQQHGFVWLSFCEALYVFGGGTLEVKALEDAYSSM